MTKQELYNSLIAKYEKVLPVDKWVKRKPSGLLGVDMYGVTYFIEGVGFKDDTVFVDNDGGKDEIARFGSNNPLKVVEASLEQLKLQEYNVLRQSLV